MDDRQNGWTCPRCHRIWAPHTKGCDNCNAAVDVARMHGFEWDGTYNSNYGDPPGTVRKGPWAGGKLGNDDQDTPE